MASQMLSHEKDAFEALVYRSEESVDGVTRLSCEQQLDIHPREDLPNDTSAGWKPVGRHVPLMPI